MSNLPRRGRPPTSSIEQRIKEGMVSNSQVKCHMCHRVFPRMKSLRAHLNCHTGFTPYKCDYPGCGAAFRQSGHLRSHIFRHTNEKPFKCKTEGCLYRYTHANRHCPEHDKLKLKKLKRDKNSTPNVQVNNLSEEEKQWFIRYMERRKNQLARLRNRNNNSSGSRNIKKSNNPGPSKNIISNNPGPSRNIISNNPGPSRNMISINNPSASSNIMSNNIPGHSKSINRNNNPIDYSYINRNSNPCVYSYMNRNNTPQGTKRPAENDSDAENIPVNKKTGYEDDGYNSAGSSPFSSPIHKSEESDTGSDSSSSSSYGGLDEGGIKAAAVLARFKNKSFPIDGFFNNSGNGKSDAHFTKLK